MALANYQFNLYSIRTGGLLAIYDAKAVYEVKYSRVLNDVGVFAMTLVASDENDRLFEVDNLLEVLRTDPVTGRLEVEETYLVRLTERLQENDFEFYVVGGVSLNHLLSRRIVDPNDDPLAAGGYSTKADFADNVMREYALEQGGPNSSADRRFPNYTVATVASAGLGAGERLRHENLMDVFQKIARKAGVDFYIHRVTENQLELQIGPMGTDRSMSRNYPTGPFVLIDPKRGNLTNPRLTRDRKDEKNYVYVKAQGPGDMRIIFEQAAATTGDSPLNRIEFAADSRSSTTATEVLSSARSELAENEPVTEFSFDLRGNEPGNTYRRDWDIADTITAQWGDFREDLRIVEVEISLQENSEQMRVKTETP